MIKIGGKNMENANMALVSMVAIVAVVGMISLVFMITALNRQEVSPVAAQSGTENLAGQAYVLDSGDEEPVGCYGGFDCPLGQICIYLKQGDDQGVCIGSHIT